MNMFDEFDEIKLAIDGIIKSVCLDIIVSNKENYPDNMKLSDVRKDISIMIKEVSDYIMIGSINMMSDLTFNYLNRLKVISGGEPFTRDDLEE